jgi:hypothetical protein
VKVKKMELRTYALGKAEHSVVGVMCRGFCGVPRASV